MVAVLPVPVDNLAEVPLATLAPIATDAVDEEQALVARAQSGEKDALNDLLGTHYDHVYAVCRRMTGNDADAADATQEALIAVARSVGRFDGRSRFSTWIYRIAMNAAIDELRRRSRRPIIGLEAARPATMESSETVDSRVDIDAALRTLPDTLRAAVVLRDLCGLDYAEIAQVLDIPDGTVRSRIARGRASLVRALGPTRSLP